MNEHTLSDPKLQSLEARLAAMSPRATIAEQQKLLYGCGFAAGRRSSARTLRVWQAAAAALVVLSLGLSVPLAQSRSMIANERKAPFVPTETSPSPLIAQRDAPPTSRQTKPVELDAWQVEPSAGALLASEVARFEQTDPHLRSLSVGTLSRSVFQP